MLSTEPDRVHRLSVALQVDKKDHPLFPYSHSSAAPLQTKSKRKNQSVLDEIPAKEFGPPAVSDTSPPQDKARATSRTEELLRRSFEFLISFHSKHLDLKLFGKGLPKDTLRCLAPSTCSLQFEIFPLNPQDSQYYYCTNFNPVCICRIPRSTHRQKKCKRWTKR